MNLELLFDKAIEISSNTKKDKLQITLNKEFFFSKGGLQLEEVELTFTLPP